MTTLAADYTSLQCLSTTINSSIKPLTLSAPTVLKSATCEPEQTHNFYHHNYSMWNPYKNFITNPNSIFLNPHANDDDQSLLYIYWISPSLPAAMALSHPWHPLNMTKHLITKCVLQKSTKLSNGWNNAGQKIASQCGPCYLALPDASPIYIPIACTTDYDKNASSTSPPPLLSNDAPTNNSTSLAMLPADCNWAN